MEPMPSGPARWTWGGSLRMRVRASRSGRRRRPDDSPQSSHRLRRPTRHETGVEFLFRNERWSPCPAGRLAGHGVARSDRGPVVLRISVTPEMLTSVGPQGRPNFSVRCRSRAGKRAPSFVRLIHDVKDRPTPAPRRAGTAADPPARLGVQLQNKVRTFGRKSSD